MFGISKLEELMVVFIVLLLVLGKKLPELSRGLATSIREIRGAYHDEPRENEKTRVQ
jgi:Sec-independent protein translocase protein TatA